MKNTKRALKSAIAARDIMIPPSEPDGKYRIVMVGTPVKVYQPDLDGAAWIVSEAPGVIVVGPESLIVWE